MKSYGALTIISRILKIIGWITIAFGVLSFFLVIVGSANNPYSMGYLTRGSALVGGIVVGLAFLIIGIFVLASGEMIEAIVDIAINSAKLPDIATASLKAAEFYNRMSESTIKRVSAGSDG